MSADEKIPVINVTNAEYRCWCRAKEYDEALKRRGTPQDQGYLGRWVLDNLGRSALLAIAKGACLIRRPNAKRIPCRDVPRIEQRTQAELAALESAIEEDGGTYDDKA